ncbi:LacI family transcriptional regulator, partial [Listeria monocytogenes]|nr:LacI family transcriptional regulator [Listeria monocytogenes]
MRNIKIGLFVCLFLACLSGCQANKETTTETSEESIVIGFSQSGTESSWRKRHT